MSPHPRKALCAPGLRTPRSLLQRQGAMSQIQEPQVSRKAGFLLQNMLTGNPHGGAPISVQGWNRGSLGGGAPERNQVRKEIGLRCHQSLMKSYHDPATTPPTGTSEFRVKNGQSETMWLRGVGHLAAGPGWGGGGEQAVALSPQLSEGPWSQEQYPLLYRAITGIWENSRETSGSQGGQ